MVRSKSSIYSILSTTPSEDDEHISNNSLPSNKTVLLSYLFRKDRMWKHNRRKKHSFSAARETILEEIKPIYEKFQIPMKDDKNMVHEILKYYNRMQAVMKIEKSRRISSFSARKVNNFKKTLDKTMKFWANDALECITNEESKQLLIRIQSGSKATGFKRNNTRNIVENVDFDYEEGSNVQEECKGQEYLPEVSSEEQHRRMKKTGEWVFIPPDILKSPEFISSAVRNNVSPTALSAIMKSLISSCNGDISKFNLDATQSYRYRVECVAKLAEDIQCSWTPPDIGNLHWDGKIQCSLKSKYLKEERLPVLVSEMADSDNKWLLAALPLDCQHLGNHSQSAAVMEKSESIMTDSYKIEEKMFKCQECQEKYTADGLNTVMPVLLDCGHDICRDCAKKVLCDNGVLCCPDRSCQKKHNRFPLDSLPTIWALIKRNQNILTSGKAHPSIDKKITVHARNMCGNTFQLNVNSNATVDQFMRICQDRTGYHSTGFNVIFEGKRLEMQCGFHITDYGIGDKSEVLILLELKGD